MWTTATALVIGLLHVRNIHRSGYDIERLVAGFPALAPHVVAGHERSSVDFSQPEAVGTLNAALLSVDYGVKFELPDGHLCPAVPGRADYIHLLADLLASDAPDGNVPLGQAVRGIDIGVGASCIYPLIGHAEYGWSFTGSDVDVSSLESADALVRRNPSAPIELCHQRSPEHVLRDVLQPQQPVAFTMCNPPFYASAEEAAATTARKWRGLSAARKRRSGRGRGSGRGSGRSGPGGGRGGVRSFGGSERELWCPGGERRFVTTHIRESAQMREAALWFTSLVSAESSLPKLRAELSAAGASCVEELSVSTGNKQMRVLAWSYMADRQRRSCLRNLLGADEGKGAPDMRRSEATEVRAAASAPPRKATSMRRRGHVSAALAILMALCVVRRPAPAWADLASAGAGGLPLLGRFEKLSGANAFIGEWSLYTTDDGPSGVLVLLRDGDVELRARGSSAKLLGTGVQPWTYVTPKKGESMVKVSFSIDADRSVADDVLYFDGAVDANLGQARKLEGMIRTGYGRRIADFTAVPVAVNDE